jgi:hypothetical protein
MKRATQGKLRARALVIVLAVACSRSDHFQPVPMPVQGRSATADARSALAVGDARFLLYAGPFWWQVLGIDSLCARNLPSKRLRYVRYVGDVVEPPRDTAAARAATADTMALDEYVREYNRTVARQTDTCVATAAA